MLKFDDRGLIPAIAQDAESGRVLMLAYMNAESLRRTLESGQVWFYSRSRRELWHKGATSGSYLNLRRVVADCDGDALLLLVEPTGPVCHTGADVCFFDDIAAEPESETAVGSGILDEVFDVIEGRKRELPEGSYVASLFRGGLDRIAKKVGEEAAESIIAAKNGDPEPLAAEVADLWFHTLIMLSACGLEPEAIYAELRRRRR